MLLRIRNIAQAVDFFHDLGANVELHWKNTSICSPRTHTYLSVSVLSESALRVELLEDGVGRPLLSFSLPSGNGKTAYYVSI